MSHEHEDFLKAPEAARWTGDLPGLFYTLGVESYRLHGRWARRVLRGGAWVGMRVKPDDFPRKELFIGRSRAPAERYQAAWAKELETFLVNARTHPAGGWLPLKEDRPANGSIKAFFVELRPLEVAPDLVRCQGEGCDETVKLGDPPFLCPSCQRIAEVAAARQAVERRAGPRRADEQPAPREAYGGHA